MPPKEKEEKNPAPKKDKKKNEAKKSRAAESPATASTASSSSKKKGAGNISMGTLFKVKHKNRTIPLCVLFGKRSTEFALADSICALLVPIQRKREERGGAK